MGRVITRHGHVGQHLGLLLLLQAQGKLSLAEPFFRRALEGFERTLGPITRTLVLRLTA